MASLLDAQCLCEAWWRGRRPRPWCPVHERAAKIVADAEAYLAVYGPVGSRWCPVHRQFEDDAHYGDAA